MKTLSLIILLALPTLFASALTLDEAIALAKQRSLAQQPPRIEQQRTRGQLFEAWSNALPQIEGNIGYQRALRKGKIFFPNPDTGELTPFELDQNNAVQAGVTLNQPLLTFGRVSAGVRGADAAMKATQHAVVQQDRQTELDVMQRFWTVLMLRDVVAARELSLTVSDSSLLRAQRMRDVGLMSDYDVLRVRVQAQNQRPLLDRARSDLQIAELVLKEYLGVPLDTTVTVDGTLATFAVTADLAPEAADFGAREDLSSLREYAHARQHVYTIYSNARWPVLGGQLRYAWQWQDNDWEMNPRNENSAWYAGLSLNVPIWSSGAISGKAMQARADWNHAQWTLAQAERGARLQLESARNDFTTATANEEAATLAVELAEQARRIAQTKFGQGQITTLELDAAQLDELTARVSLADATYRRLLASAQLRIAQGRAPYTN